MQDLIWRWWLKLRCSVILMMLAFFKELITSVTCICSDFITKGYWPFGLVLCNVWQVSDVVMCTSSIMHMCSISLDRYMGIRYPIKTRNRSRLLVGVKIGAVWIISLAIASPLVVLATYWPEEVNIFYHKLKTWLKLIRLCNNRCFRLEIKG